MAKPSIVADGLSKRYRSSSNPTGWLEALSDVSFDVEAGEGVGLIGRNGAGKSTLLRILSRVTRPTAGHVDVYGTVGALLEVGTGFHPELTGRENTYLSGAILGLSKAEVRSRFDEIVAFAEIEPFIDTPVKRYSSGMYARLGFAVAAHLRPSILIVDEVLAVGDLAFQAKCLAHMHCLTEDGTTVLFVSHNLLAVADLCTRALLLDGGRLRLDSTVGESIAAYRRLLLDVRGGDEAGAPLQVEFNGRSAPPVFVYKPGSSIEVGVRIDRAADAESQPVSLNLLVESGGMSGAVIHLRSDLSGADLELHPGVNRYIVKISDLPLAPGDYSVWLRLASILDGEPFIADSARHTLLVSGDQRVASVLAPAHSFVQLDANRIKSTPTGAVA